MPEAPEATLEYCTVREALNDIDDIEYHIECRLTNGEKGAFVIIPNFEHEWLADLVRKLLNENAGRNEFGEIINESE